MILPVAWTSGRPMMIACDSVVLHPAACTVKRCLETRALLTHQYTRFKGIQTSPVETAVANHIWPLHFWKMHRSTVTSTSEFIDSLILEMTFKLVHLQNPQCLCLEIQAAKTNKIWHHDWSITIDGPNIPKPVDGFLVRLPDSFGINDLNIGYIEKNGFTNLSWIMVISTINIQWQRPLLGFINRSSGHHRWS